jgi:hypothetical protein
MSMPGMGRSGLAPAVTERAWPEMPTGRGGGRPRPWPAPPAADRTPPVPGDHPRGLRAPPNTDPSAVSPSPCRCRRAPVSPLAPLGRTAVNLAAGTGCRMCHRSPAEDDLRHTPGFRWPADPRPAGTRPAAAGSGRAERARRWPPSRDAQPPYGPLAPMARSPDARSPRSGTPTSATAPPDRGGRGARQEVRGGWSGSGRTSAP